MDVQLIAKYYDDYGVSDILQVKAYQFFFVLFFLVWSSKLKRS